MKLRIRHFSLLLLAVLLATAGMSRARGAEGSFERTLKVTGPVELDITTGSGNIDVRTGEPSSVHVRGTIRVHNASGWTVDDESARRKVQRIEDNPPIQQTGNYIRLGRLEDPALRRNVEISYELVVPAETRLKSETGSGDQSVAGIKGPVKASTGSGNLRLSNTTDEVHLDTGSGDIELSSVTGSVYAETGSGNIRASAISGSIRAHTGSGDLRLEQSSADPASLETGSGNVELHGAQNSVRAQTGSGNITIQGDPKGDWKLDTGSGNVALHLAPQASFILHAHTGSGGIETDVPITVQGKVGRTELRGVVRNGGSLVDVGTGSGDIHIE